jgi:asparagine synthase (glutamine-hydrolysing)
MCGILGIVSTGRRPEPDLVPALRRMGFWQYHRGPDGWGEWVGEGVALGQNRLAILDLVHGKQPMGSGDGRVQVVFNGEIYNFGELWRELSQKGYRFRTDHSDTEVIVHGYCEWGTGVFERLEGMFAIAVWDVSEQALFLARDRLGIKPLFYASVDDGLLFASEPKAILASGSIQPKLNLGALHDYFMFRAPVGPATLLEDVTKVAAGSWCRYDRTNGMGAPRVFWQPQAAKSSVTDLKLIEREVERTLEDAAVSHLVADVPVGLFLSGGVDYSHVAAVVAKHARVSAFTVATHSKLDESSFAARVADHLGLKLHVRWVTGDDFRARFDDWSFFNDDPVSDPSALALMLITEHAREGGMKVMLAGEGADELFGGYSSYVRYRGYSLLSCGPWANSIARLFGHRSRGVDGDYLSSLGDLPFFGSAHVMHARDRRSLFTGSAMDSVAKWERDAFPRHDPRSDVIRSAMLIDQSVRLPNDLLPRTDRATMAYSLEARVPYLDRRVVELANGLPANLCLRLLPPQRKWLLKRIAARHVPREVIYRHKRGFNVPVEQWLAVDFSERIDDFLRERLIEVLNYDYLETLRREHDGGRHRAALLWAWLVLEQWFRLWVRGEARPPRPAIIADTDAYDLLARANQLPTDPRFAGAVADS